VSRRRPRLAFVSPLFLFPNDAGGKIRTTNVLRVLKGGEFEIRLLSPATTAECERWSSEIESVSDQFVRWEPRPPRPRPLRALDLFGQLPVNVAADVCEHARREVEAQARRGDVDLFVFDFVHASVLRPDRLPVPSICFTHNVEAEIFGRHARAATGPLRRWLWSAQHAKMVRFEQEALRRYDKVIAVSDRDAEHFEKAYGLREPEAIPTGVDLDYFGWSAPLEAHDGRPPTIIYVASMDSAANRDAVEFFVRQVWPLVRASRPEARFLAVGRNPPARLTALARSHPGVEFTGSVPDVRPFLHEAQACVIPLLVGGGTRIKAYEAMAAGCPVVSTRVGIEGLELEPGQHYLEADEPREMAAAVLRLLDEPALGRSLSERARAFVEQRFGHRVAGQVFESICLRTLGRAP
jgi:glycosyltransferase involved in cell wall biosynthesis